jgi:hypothetical protein
MVAHRHHTMRLRGVHQVAASIRSRRPSARWRTRDDPVLATRSLGGLLGAVLLFFWLAIAGSAGRAGFGGGEFD